MGSVKTGRWFTQLFAKPAEKPSVSPFHAVVIHCGTNACQAAQDTLGQRHLSVNPPILPLEQCDRPDQCECRYEHYADRRDDPRRSSEQASPPQTDSERPERRGTKGRRAKDVPKGTGSLPVNVESYYEYAGDANCAAMLEASKAEDFDPYNSGRFDKSKASGSGSGE
jgi:hypothetical protein